MAIYRHQALIALAPLVIRDRDSFWGSRRLTLAGYPALLEPFGLTEQPIALGFEDLSDSELQKFLNFCSALGKSRKVDATAIRVASNRSSGFAKLLWFHKSKPGSRKVKMPDTWAEYRKALGRSMRDNMAYYPNLVKRAGLELEVRRSLVSEDLSSAIANLVDLHRRRCAADHAGRHTSYLECSDTLAMLHAVCYQVPGAFIAEMLIDSHVVASQLFVRSGKELTLLYSGFNPEFARYSPLFILQSKVIREEFEAGVTRLNLLPGHAQWQERWLAHSDGYFHKYLRIASSPVSLARAAIYAFKKEAQNFRRHNRAYRKLASIRQSKSAIVLCESLPHWSSRFVHGLHAHVHHIHGLVR